MNKTDMPEILWAVYTNTDLTEGRGRQYVKHLCKIRATALRLAKGSYVQGGDCPVEPLEVRVLDGQRVLPMTLMNIEQPSREDDLREVRLNAKDAALEKAKSAGLSDDDIALIGARL